MTTLWRIKMDVPETLNFAIFVGYAFKILPDIVFDDKVNKWPVKKYSIEESLSHDELREAWIDWWEGLLKGRQESKQKLSRPHTDGIASKKFKDLCEEVWPDFHEWWSMPAGGHMAMTTYTTMGNGEVRTLIKEFEERLGRSVQRFSLEVDLVYAGIGEVMEVSSDYVVMPITPPPYYNTEWWRKKISEIG